MKPQYGAAHINWSHPLAQGLGGCLPLNEGVGATSYELTHRIASTVAAGTPTWTQDVDGPAWALDGTDRLEWALPDAPFLGAITVMVRARVDAGGTYQQFCGKHTGGGATNTPFGLRTSNDATPQLSIGRAGPSAFRTYKGGALTVGRMHSLAAVYYNANVSTTAPSLYVDGVAVSISVEFEGGGIETVTGSGAPVYVGGRPDGGVAPNGIVSLLYLWSRALTAGDIAALHVDPYAYLSRPRRQRGRRLTAAVEPGTVAPHYYQRRRALLAGAH